MKKFLSLYTVYVLLVVVFTYQFAVYSDTQPEPVNADWKYGNTVVLIVNDTPIIPTYLRVNNGRLDATGVSGSLIYQGQSERIYITVPVDIFPDGWNTIQIISTHKSITDTYYKTNVEPDTVYGGVKIEFRNSVRSLE